MGIIGIPPFIDAISIGSGGIPLLIVDIMIGSTYGGNPNAFGGMNGFGGACGGGGGFAAPV